MITCQGPVGPPLQLVNPVSVVAAGTVCGNPNGTPCSRAVIRVNSLDEEPVCTPTPPSYGVFTA